MTVPNDQYDSSLAEHVGYFSMGPDDNYQATDDATIDRHIIR